MRVWIGLQMVLHGAVWSILCFPLFMMVRPDEFWVAPFMSFFGLAVVYTGERLMR